jgi:hypothetical protein
VNARSGTVSTSIPLGARPERLGRRFAVDEQKAHRLSHAEDEAPRVVRREYVGGHLGGDDHVALGGEEELLRDLRRRAGGEGLVEAAGRQRARARAERDREARDGVGAAVHDRGDDVDGDARDGRALAEAQIGDRDVRDGRGADVDEVHLAALGEAAERGDRARVERPVGGAPV